MFVHLLLYCAAAASAEVDATVVPDGSIHVDGVGDDEGWRGLLFRDGFSQQDPDEGAAPTEATRFKIAYDSHALYVLVEALDHDSGSVVGQLTRRDANSPSDWLNVWLDTYDDDRSAYRFSVNPAGVRQDARLVDTTEDVTWDGVWRASTRTSSTGWTAEMRIPFSQLRYDGTHRRWGFTVSRHLQRRAEISYFGVVPRGTDRLVSYFGELGGLEALPSPLAVTFVPYALGGTTIDPEGARPTGTLGGDARMGLESGLDLALTINPDFGQIEADPSVLNLDPTEVFFEERRPFFLEGREHTAFQLGFGNGGLGQNTLFYSRRIGRAPQLDTTEGENERVVRSPGATRILGATKLTGKTTSGWYVGVMDALVGSASATIENDDRDRRSERVEPLSNAIVARGGKDFDGGKTTISLMGTHLYRDLDLRSEAELERHAASAGAEVTHRIESFQLVGRLFGTHVSGTKEAITALQTAPVHYFQRPDADHLRVDENATSLSGWGASAVAGKLGGQDWRAAAGAFAYSPGLEPNALGFLPRADKQIFFLWAQKRDDTPGPLHRRWEVNWDSWVERSFGGELLAGGANVGALWAFPTQDYVFCGAGRDLENLDATRLRGGPALQIPGGWFGWVGFGSDDRRMVSFTTEVNAFLADFDIAKNVWMSITATLRPTSAIEISLAPTAYFRTSDVQYVDTVDDRPIVGTIDQRTLSLALRANWTLSPDLSLQVYAAPFLAAGTYENFREVTSARAERYEDRFAPFAYQGDDRFHFVELRSNVVLRWEYMQGSTLFVAWSHAQSEDDPTRGHLRANDVGTLLKADSTDVIMLKLAHWFSL